MTPQNQSQLMHTLETKGLPVALEHLKQEIAGITRVAPPPMHLEVEPDVEKLLSQEAQNVIFSLAMESLANACNHAQADNLYLRLYRDKMQVIMTVEDDGAGFDVVEMEKRYAKLPPEKRPDFRERAATVNGQMAIHSTIGQGTKIMVTVPVTEAE